MAPHTNEGNQKGGNVTVGDVCEKIDNCNVGTDFTFERKIVWKNAIGFLILHLLALYGYFIVFSGRVKFATVIWICGIGWLAGEGITIGAHRMWTHRSFRGTPTLRLILMMLQTLAGQNCIWIWVRDHRQHHRYTDTDADPHNATRGFFFSHIGWLMSKKHPSVIKLGKTINMDDLNSDKIVMFQKEHYKKLYVLFAILLPTCVPVFVWNENWFHSLFACYFGQYLTVLNLTWTVNSIAHLFGYKPYDENILPVESKFVSIISSGEGWHNYHHVFPWDYKAAEFGTSFQLTSYVIRGLERLGLAYDLKQASSNMVNFRSNPGWKEPVINIVNIKTIYRRADKVQNNELSQFLVDAKKIMFIIL